MGLCSVFKTCFTLAENTSHQPPTVARTLEMPSGWKVSNAQLHLSHFCFKFVFQDFSRLGLNGRLLIPAFYIYLTATLRVAGLQMQADNDVQLTG